MDLQPYKDRLANMPPKYRGLVPLVDMAALIAEIERLRAQFDGVVRIEYENGDFWEGAS